VYGNFEFAQRDDILNNVSRELYDEEVWYLDRPRYDRPRDGFESTWEYSLYAREQI
jgi:hypothetical protein